MKRTIAFFLVICLLLAMLPVAALAADTSASGTWGSGTWTLDTDGVLTVRVTGPLTGDGGWSAHAKKIRTLVLEEGVTAIPDGCFQALTALTAATIPDSVRSIGSGAFKGCTALTEITVPGDLDWLGTDPFANTGYSGTAANWKNSALYLGGWLLETKQALTGVCSVASGTTHIAKDAFKGNTKLTGVILPDTLRRIGDSAFQGCTGLAGITVPDGVTVIGEAAFQGCTGLTSATISNGVHTIGQDAFRGCTGLVSVNIPGSLKTVGASMFSGCSKLKSVTIPDTVAHIEKNAFAGTVVYSTAANWKNDVLYIGNHLIEAKKTLRGAYAVKDGTVSIADNAFYGCTGLSGVAIPKGTVCIGASAFQGCTGLTSVTIPDTVVQIHADAFKNTAIYNKSSSWTDGVLYLGRYLIDAKTTLSGVYTVREGTTCIADNVFRRLGSLTCVIVPAGVTAVGDEVFRGCPKLEGVIFRGNAPAYAGADVFTDTKAAAFFSQDTVGWTEPTWNGWPARMRTATRPFIDVPEEKYYAEAVRWALINGITSGKTEYNFAPEAVCTRADVVSFLWRVCGSPRPVSDQNPFRDVPAGKYYTDAVLWAVENGITAGVDATHFAPNKTVTRGQFVAFLYRAKGSPAVSGENPFQDVKAGQYYTDPVLWAVGECVTSGVSDTKFAPGDPCTRGQVVTFLHRAYN